ncbi:related to ABC transporter [Phialocephala subalpina]|uniref:Related to ABC transporter n=1 Tax=Phialocephala subalpina TaxID=576137 RepID=A0A1L7WC99_9HELO|nr:related to ABC transporter [Phialocephala subalpina]
MGLLLRQIFALVQKDLFLFFSGPKSRLATAARALWEPVILSLYLAILLKIYWPKENYGVGQPHQLLSLPDAMQIATGGRDTVVLVNDVSAGGDIDRVINSITQPVQASGKTVVVLNKLTDLLQTCPSTLQGTTKCFGAVVFNSSPKEGPGGIWNYTLRADAAFGVNVDVGKTNNDPEVYQLPLQRAVDAAIASVNTTSDAIPLPALVDEYRTYAMVSSGTRANISTAFTSLTQQEWKDKITTDIQHATTNYLSVVWYIGFVGVMYHLVGLMAKERETGMSDLVESMMPNVRRWECQVARLFGHFLAFSIAYLPGWIIMGIFAKIGLFKETSGGIVVAFFILSGLSLTSFSILGASFFRKAQLSGITTVILALCLGIIAQIMSKKMDSATVVILGLLFTPMTFVFFLSAALRFDSKDTPAKLGQSAPDNHWPLPIGVLWALLVIQIIVYPILAMYVERWLYGTASHRSRRNVSWQGDESRTPVRLTNFKKVYQKNILLRLVTRMFCIKLSPVIAINDLSLTALKGQILVLVGANGCGKTTVLSAIAGLNSITDGSIDIDGSGGIGLCPQNDVLWNGLTVEQHAKIFYALKTVTGSNPKTEVEELIKQCGLEDKKKSFARTLSGGQKRKLQLIMMLIGGSRVCCVDEVSGGLDPLSRRRIWDILLAERGNRTFILTTHFLDEAEYLADHISIISKGLLKAEGSTSELKARLGSGYRVFVSPGTDDATNGNLAELSRKKGADEAFLPVDPATALERIKTYKSQGVKNFQITGPTIEEVFMKIAVDANEDPDSEVERVDILHDSHSKLHREKGFVDVKAIDDTTLLTGRRIGTWQQIYVLFRKRLTILRWNWIGPSLTFIIPVAGAALVSILITNFQNPGCAFIDQISISDIQNLSGTLSPQMVVGPQSALTVQKLELFSRVLPNISQSVNESSFLQGIHIVNSLDEFINFTNTNYSTIVPGGLFLGSQDVVPTYNYRSDLGTLGVYSAVFIQNALNVLLSNQTIVTQYAVFDLPWPPDTQDSLQFVFYFGLVMAAYPAFFALYPTAERVRGVRALQYSNGVRSFPLWLAYLAFDGVIVLFVSVLVTIIFATAAPHAWFSLGTRSQLSAFAFSAGGQAFMLLMYMSAYMNITVSSPAEKTQWEIMLVHYTLGIITPIGQMLRATFVGLNLFSALCSGSPPVKATSPGPLTLFGAPILYLICQSLCLFGILVWNDHRFSISMLRRSASPVDTEDTTTKEPEVSEEINRVATSDDGLKVLHASKTFRTKDTFTGKNKVLDDLTFGVKRGEVFALVGPNGAGKSTTIAMIRGELKPDHGPGEIFVENISVARDRDIARSHLGVCPQNDPLDQMTVLEHLRFYAGIRGLKDLEQNVDALVTAVGLAPFRSRMASKLSGGNKRKLGLAIALIGNPDVLLLDEPSSGMDPLAKRSMWTTLSRFVPHRSILLTTHSMEEADALASRVGILAKHMLDLGTTQHLRTKHGYGFHVTLVLRSAPASGAEEMETLKVWIEERFRGAVMERRMWNGQLRFNIPSKSPPRVVINGAEVEEEEVETSVGSIFVLLEENNAALGLEFYSVSVSTLDEVFLKVVGKHGVGEENVEAVRRKWWTRWLKW